MALKLALKPQERMILGGTVITNGNSKTELIIENKVPLLREKDIMSEADATSPTRRIYYIIQLMYVDNDHMRTYHDRYWELVRDLVDAAPALLGIIDQISELIVGNQYYQALKLAKALIKYEEEVTSCV
jgi:flagellar protein FlbT